MALKRLLGTFAAIVLAAGLVAGCGKTGTAPKEAQAPSAEEESVDAEAEAAEEKGEDAAAAEAESAEEEVDAREEEPVAAKQEVFPETVLMDRDGVKVTVEGFGLGDYGDKTITATVTNNTSADIEATAIEIIADGIHVPSDLLKLVVKIKGTEHIALVTDSMRAAGMPEGPSILGGLQGGQEVIVEDGVAKLLDRSAFAGSVATTDRLVRTMVREACVSLPEAVRMVTVNPARIMGIADRKGRISPGFDADIVIFDNDINISETIIKGKTVYRNERI